MDDKYICYCGLYCDNCAVMAKVAPAAKTLYDEMLKAGYTVRRLGRNRGQLVETRGKYGI